MTRHKWTTKEQDAWLEERLPKFIEVNQRKAAAKEFFPDMLKAFIEKWPVEPVTAAEIKDAGNAEFAMRVKKGAYEQVRPFPSNTRRCAYIFDSEYPTGSPTKHGHLHQVALAAAKMFLISKLLNRKRCRRGRHIKS